MTPPAGDSARPAGLPGPVTPSHLLIAGVNKAGTTSLFASLSEHPGIAAASIKETRYFLPARYSLPLEPVSLYDLYFNGAAPGAVRLEATPSYLYGGGAVADEILGSLPDPAVLVVLREPVSRAVSFFRYQKARLRIPPELTLAEYLTEADALTDADFDDPANEPFMAYRGGRYADFLPPWLERFGPDRLRVVFFEDLVQDPAPVLRGTLEWIGLDPDALPAGALSSENRTTGYRSGWLQRVALAGNDRLEPFFRKHMGLKRRLRALYYQVNGRTPTETVTDETLAGLAERYAEPDARLTALLGSAGVELPSWLVDATLGDVPRDDRVTVPPTRKPAA